MVLPEPKIQSYFVSAIPRGGKSTLLALLDLKKARHAPRRAIAYDNLEIYKQTAVTDGQKYKSEELFMTLIKRKNRRNC